MKIPGPAALVVDDEPDLRSIVARLLRRQGFDVAEARDGFEAANMFADSSNDFCLVVTDHDMPRMNGAGLIRWLRERHPEVSIVLMSGDHRATAAFPKMNDVHCIEKPFGVREFDSVVRLCKLIPINPM